MWPDMIAIPPLEQFYWVIAVVVPFMPVVLEYRGFYNHVYL
jgi:hypothetical protein